MRADAAHCCRWASEPGLGAAAVCENGETCFLENRLGRRRAEKLEHPCRARVLAVRSERSWIDNRRVGVLGKRRDDLDPWIGSSIGGIDDAERGFATRHEQQGGAYAFR